ncbi:hypothetical protein Tco_0722290 [Tanacetum coccineum]
MRDKNQPRTLGDYSRPSHEGYRNIIELPEGDNVSSLLSDTIQLVQNGYAFHKLRSEDPNQHLKDFLKLVDSLDLNGANRESESLFEAWTRFKDLLQTISHHGIDLWLLIQIFYDHVSYTLKREINHDANSAKPISAISLPQDILRTFDQRLLELEDQINYLLKGLKTTPRTNPTQLPQSYASVVSSNQSTQSFSELPKQNSYTFQKRAYPEFQQRTLEPRFEARVQCYMEAYTERMERFEEDIYRQIEEHNGRMTEMFSILKECKHVEKVLVREVVSKPVTNKVLKGEEIEEDVDNDESNRSENKDPTRWGKYMDRLMEVPRSRPIGYYLKHSINKKTIEDLVDNHKYNDALLTTRIRKMDSETYKSLPIEPMYNAILKKKLARKKGGEGNFVIACSIGKLIMNSLADQGSDVNIMPLTIYNKLTREIEREFMCVCKKDKNDS